MRVVFMGTPDFAVPTLAALIENHEVVGVVTQPDKRIKAAAMERSFVSYVLADASKFDKVSTVSFAPLDQAAIITDRLPDPEYGERTVVKEVALL